MSAITTRDSVLAVVPETTEGVPVIPGGATAFTALQDDFDMSPEFESLSNAELKSSIAPGKPITGAESPTVTFSHYLRHSGVEGTAPDFNDLLKAAWGTETANSTQRTLTSGSTQTVLALGAGGSDFSRGFAVLVKDGTNGYSIRAVHSVSSNNLTLGFPVTTAPATGIGVGKCVNYSPANSAHQALSLWHYLGNGGAVQLMAGSKVTQVAYDLSAGQFATGTYDLEGNSYYFDPINITATDTKLDFTDDDGTFAATITAKTYKDPHDLASALTDAMNTANSGETHTVTYSNTTGKFTIISTGSVLSLLWNTGTNTANTVGDKIGFSTAADSTGTAAATGYTSATAVSYASPYTPTFDTSDPLIVKNNEIMLNDGTLSTCIVASSAKFTLANTNRRISSICAESGFAGSVFNKREVTVDITAQLEKYDVSRFKAYRSNDNVRFQFSFGVKTGGNWVAGKSGCIYVPTATISVCDVNDDDGLASLTLQLKAYADDSGNGEAYLNFL